MIDRFDGEYRFLSNFYPARVVLGDVSYPTVEHAYQACKTVDPIERQAIRSCATAGKAKRLGRHVHIREDWEYLKLSWMEHLLRQKFREPALAQKLLDTGEEELVEGNYWEDYYWGVCRGTGNNHLGKLLMMIRAELREGKMP